MVQFNSIKTLASLIFICVINITSVFTQEKKITKNELKFNALLALYEFPEITYERILNNENAIGISAAASLGKNSNTNNDDTIKDYSFSLIPYYRFYFGKKKAAGFFIEANTPMFSQRHVESGFFRDEKKGGFGVGLGVGIGGKFMTKSGWIGEIYTGVAKTVINTEDLISYYPRVGITLGKRF